MELYPEKMRSACGLSGIMDESGERFSGEEIISSISVMQERSNGLGAGFAAYGIYPEFSDLYAFHVIYENEDAKESAEEYLEKKYKIREDEPIPTREPEGSIDNVPILWRYFLEYDDGGYSDVDEKDYIVDTVMDVNREIEGAFIISSGKNMGIFKGVGFPEDIGRFYRLDEYKGHIWIAHGRFPTNTSGWWGGAHPFGLLDWAIAHNGEISSYGINRRFLLDYGYHCTLSTDSEVIAYLFDLFSRKHNFDYETISKILASPFWSDIDRDQNGMSEIYRTLRMTYGSALVNGPFAVIVGQNDHMVGLNDRIKLRPLVAGRSDDRLYMASEEAGIREVCQSPDRIWSPEAGEPVIGRLR